VYSAPFDSLSIEYHRERINWGLGYLLLVSSSDKTINDFFLVDSREFEFETIRSYTNVDNLLNGKIDTFDFEGIIPISSRILAMYDKIETCELTKEIFRKDGYYKAPFYLKSSNYILASLVRRGALITIGDFDGTLIINNESVSCDYLDKD